jgi:hypothetical protein
VPETPAGDTAEEKSAAVADKNAASAEKNSAPKPALNATAARPQPAMVASGDRRR